MDKDGSIDAAKVPVADKVEQPDNASAVVAPPDEDAYLALKSLEEKRKKKRRDRNIKIVVAVAVVAAAIGIWAFMNSTNGEEDPDEYLPETAMVMREDFSTSISASGSLQPASSVVVTPEVDGVIQQVMVSEGDHVEEGDVLFTMRSPELEKAVNTAAQAVDDAASEVSSARSSVSSMQKAYKKAKKEYQKQKSAAEKAEANARVKGEKARQKAYDAAIAAIPEDATKAEARELTKQAEKAGQDAYDQAYAAVPIPEVDPFDDAAYVEQIESAKSAVSAARSSLSAAQQEYNEAAAELDKCIVRAPQAGTLLSFDAVVGSAVGDGDSGASGSLAQIAELSQMKVNVEVNEIDISSVERGQRAKVTFSAFPDLELEARVADIGSVASGSEDGDFGGGGIVTFKVDLIIDKPDPRLKLGMTASVDILTQDVPNALVIPVSALMEDEDGSATVDVVLDEETYETETRPVKVGAKSPSEAVIKKGLKEGEIVMTYGMGGMDMGVFGDDAYMEDDEG